MQAWPSGVQTFGPQKPMLLHGPLQHGAAGLHCTPSGKHMPGWQMPLPQISPGQHGGLPGKHGAPGGMHGPPLQAPLMHGPLQHGGRPTPHMAPGGSHTLPPQEPLTHGRPPQQMAPGKLHAAPGGRHGPPLHTLLRHGPLQHGRVKGSHIEPGGMQPGGSQVPLLQIKPPQQVAPGKLHGAP
jgi:hypothetical protein